MSANPSSAGPSNAWDDDDWETQADKLATEPTPLPEKKVSSKVTKAQRRAQQAEFNRQLWAEAEQPETFHFLEAKSNVPLKQEFKPAVTLLSRKPQVASRPLESPALESATARIGQLGLNPENDFDDSEENNDRPEPSPEERQAMALRNREEKQRKYEEVRERLFGSPSAPTSGSSSRSATPPKDGRGKGKSRSGGRNNRNGRDSSAASGNSRQLYDPGQNPNSAAVYLQREERQPTGEQQQTRQDFRNSKGEHHWRGVLETGPRGAGSS